ncbi:hydrogenase maturation nickel metallochaperone HypA [Tepidibacter hydrothermalis]|uniref:Hydrogenase maturation factor HypA n=1 Tax=Tepidibacter hydrothermalis TaxID=3036126 RepID=A0ABY8EH41_9FIRM|nr:hydrogenase maturation nickel metallochaperone HypA [Tepidibacter hydrothermalis]WFD12261.1 hydrogenase maturation nickel metallochaperone HypA [Tepidibacter hydrothermalis]
MHEVSIMGEIFDVIKENADNHNLKKVNKIVLKIGEFTCVQESALRFAFEAFSKDTNVEEADFIIDKIEASAKCDNCEETFKVNFTNKVCPKCNTFSNNIITGYELLLDEIEGE